MKGFEKGIQLRGPGGERSRDQVDPRVCILPSLGLPDFLKKLTHFLRFHIFAGDDFLLVQILQHFDFSVQNRLHDSQLFVVFEMEIRFDFRRLRVLPIVQFEIQILEVFFGLLMKLLALSSERFPLISGFPVADSLSESKRSFRGRFAWKSL